MSEQVEISTCDGDECKYEYTDDGPVRCPKCGEKLREPIHRYFTLSQIDDIINAARNRVSRYDTSLRDAVLITLLADLGLRIDEAVNLTRQMFDLDAGEIMLPAEIQKDYPADNISPSAATIELDPYGHFKTVGLLEKYFDKLEGDYLFPSRQKDQMTTETARNIVRELAVEADVAPRRTDGQPAGPEEAHPHAFRHSLANYMLADPETRLVDVRNRLRHRSINTTERVYEHFQRR